VKVKEAVFVAASHENPPAVRAWAVPLLITLINAKSAAIGVRLGIPLSTTPIVPLAAVTEAMTTGRASIAKDGALTAEPLL
jgi:hypothetical protein